ncbi:MAG: hypothetical protein ACKODH_07425, partial [Limisphaerales bacterium]
LDARVADDFRARHRELMRPLQARFWDVAAEGDLKDLFESAPVEQELEALKEERKRVEKALQAAIPPVQKTSPPARNEQVAHLTETTRAQLRAVEVRQAKERDALNRELAKAPSAERSAKQKELRERQQTERRALFTDAEWAESELRGSPQARQVRELRGYAATPEALRELARALHEFANANPLTPPRDGRSDETEEYRAQAEARDVKRKAFLTTRLGETGQAAFERGSDPRFHTLLKLARRLEQPAETAAHWLALQTAAQEQVRQTSQNADLAASARGLAIIAVLEETRRTLRAAVGERGWGAYQRQAGDWLKLLEK